MRVLTGAGKRVRKTAAPVAIQPLGTVLEADVDYLGQVLFTLTGRKASRLPPIELPHDYFDKRRGQYNADRLLELLFHCLPDDSLRVVGVLNADMFAAGRPFVFGYAHLRDGMAVYSLCRLREEFYCGASHPELVRSRVYRVVMHESGHTFGNPHCEDKQCVMHSVSHIKALDALSPIYCSSCWIRIAQGLGISPLSAEGRFLRGGAYLRRHQYERAAGAYRAALVLEPKEAYYHNDLGAALLALDERKEAHAAFCRAAELSHDFPAPYYNLGLLCEADQAARYFAEGLAREHDPIAAHRYIEWLYEARSMVQRGRGNIIVEQQLPRQVRN